MAVRLTGNCLFSSGVAVMDASYRVRVISKQHNLYRPLRWAATVLGVFCAVLAGATPASAVVSERPAPAPTFNGTVWTTVFSGSTIYVGGDFTAAIVGGRQIARSRLAAIDATSGALLNWAPSADASVRALAVSGGSVYAAGLFTTVNGVRRDSLARVSAGGVGVLHATFKHSISGKPYALAAGSGRLYVGGAITAVNGQTRTRLAAFNLSSGVLDATWRPTADDQVEALLATGSRVYVGGKFHKINGARDTRRLAAVNPTSGRVIADFKAGAEYITYGIAVSGSRVYGAHGGQGGRLVAYEPDGSKRWTLTTDGDPRAVTVLGDTVYVGGHFDNVCRSTRTGDQGLCLDGSIRRVKLAATDTNGELRSWTADGNGIIGVLTLAASPSFGRLAAGGAFTTINGSSQKRFALFR
jgi:hypothetical protein